MYICSLNQNNPISPLFWRGAGGEAMNTSTNKADQPGGKKPRRKKDKRVKHDYDAYPHQKRPTSLGISKNVRKALEEDGEKYNRKFKPHSEYILEQYALGNVQVKVPGTDLWMSINTSTQDAALIAQTINPDTKQEKAA